MNIYDTDEFQAWAYSLSYEDYVTRFYRGNEDRALCYKAYTLMSKAFDMQMEYNMEDGA